MTTFKESSQFSVDEKLLAQSKVIFGSCSVSDEEVTVTFEALRTLFPEAAYKIDP